MADYELIAPCHFGLEAVLKREIQNLGYKIIQVEDGKVTFAGDESAIVRANIFLRTTERILIKIGSFKATTFDENKGSPVGTIYSRERKVLGCKGNLYQK